MSESGAMNAGAGRSVGIILVNYCGCEDTCACVDSVLASAYGDLHIYVFDNASPDGSGEKLRALFSGNPKVSVFLFDENLGFGGACNFGFERAFEDGCDLVCLLNNDTMVDPAMLSALEANSDERTVAVPLMLYYDQPDLIWYGGGRFDRFGVPRHLHYRECSTETALLKSEVSFATGCCMMVPRGVYELVGGFDDSYFLYWEDADLSLRLGSAGIQIVFVPDARLFHKVSSSTGGEDSALCCYYNIRNRFYGIEKFDMGPLVWLWACASLARAVASRKPKYRYALKAYRDYRAGRMGIANDVT